jgi:hypothetical protein
MSHCKLRTPWPIHFKIRTVIEIDSLTFWWNLDFSFYECWRWAYHALLAQLFIMIYDIVKHSIYSGLQEDFNFSST